MKEAAEVHMKPGIHMAGHVEGGHFHVHDIVDHGVSEHELTDGESPDLKPMPLEVLAKKGWEIRYPNRKE